MENIMYNAACYTAPIDLGPLFRRIARFFKAALETKPESSLSNAMEARLYL